MLITIPWFSPAFRAGGPVQSIANMLRELEGSDIEFYIFCSDHDLGGEKLAGIETGTWVRYANNTQVWYCSGKKLIKQFKNVIAGIKPDIIFINGIYSWQYSLVPLWYGGNAQKILSARGMLHPGALAQKPWKKRIYLMLFTAFGLNKVNTFHATDRAEAGYIRQQFGDDTKIMLAANFPRKLAFSQPSEKIAGDLKLLTVALISPMKNHLLVIKALQQLDTKYQVQYDICGPVKDEHYWNLCLQEMKRLPPHVNVSYLGELPPTEIPALLASHHVFILPSESENFGHALYEALSSGRPVITSHGTPWNDLKSRSAGRNVSIADGNNGLAVALNYFASIGNAAYQSYCSGARAYADSSLDNDAIRDQYAGLFQLKTNNE